MGRCMTRKAISQYLDGELSPAAADAAREHFRSCADCTKILDEMRGLDEAIRHETVAKADVPDVAGRVRNELQSRGAFLRARMAAGRRRIFGESLVTMRLAGSLVAAAILLVAVVFVGDHLTRADWARRTAPVVADAERVLVRLVQMEAPSDVARLAWARQEARKLGLSDRLAEARTGAEPALANDLAYLAKTFAVLADEQPLSPTLMAQLNDGEALDRAVRVREGLKPRG